MKFALVVALQVVFISAWAQATFTASQDGPWNLGTTWGGVCAAGCVAGTDYPGPLDDAFTNEKVVTVTPNATCKNLGVSFNKVGGLSFGSPLIITGTMVGWDDSQGLPAAPTVNVIAGTPTLRFNTANLDGTNPFFVLGGDEIIAFWNKLAPLGTVIITLTKDCSIDAGDFINGGDSELQCSSINLSGGSLATPYILTTGSNIAGIRVSGGVTISSNNTLASSVPIYGTTATLSTSKLGTLSLSGVLTTTSFINTTTTTVSGTGSLITSFNGANQTQGWWYTSNVPTTITLSAGSIVSFNFDGAQNVPTRTYSNLILDGSGTKTLVGASAFTVSQLLSILTNVTLNSAAATGRTISGNLLCDGTWQPSAAVSFTGTTTQSISGDGTLTFGNGISISKAASVLTLAMPISITNGISLSAGTLNLGDNITTLSSGNFSNSGTVTSGPAGTVVVSSTSAFSGSGTTTLNNLTVTGNATTNSGVWSITGNIQNNGTITVPSTSTVTFTGGSNQTIAGNAFTIGNMVVNKTSSTLSNNSNVELLGVLTLTTGTFDADGSGSGVFTLNSDTNGDAAVGQMAGGSITGEVTFERYFNNTNNRWRNLGFPVSAVTYSELGNSISLQTNSLGIYTESVSGNADQGWSIVSGGTLNTTLGFSAYMYNTGSINISVRGPLLQNVPATNGSPYDFHVTYTDDVSQPATQDGWNFLPNPFASPINWNSVTGWTKTGVNAAAAVWDTQNGAYIYSNVGWDGVLAQGQAFWIQTNASSPVLTCTEAVKVTNADPTIYRQKGQSNENRLLITVANETNYDKTMIQFRKDATEEFDSRFDTYKLKNEIFNLSSLSPGGTNLAANVTTRSLCNSTIKLNVTNIQTGTYKLSFDGISTFVEFDSLLLIDRFTSSTKAIKDGDVFSFQVTDQPSSYGADRFELKFYFNDLEQFPTVSAAGENLVSTYSENNQWYLNGEVIPGATGQSIKATNPGAYSVRVSFGNCEVQSLPIYWSENSEGSDQFFDVFPNPASDKVTVNVAGLLDASSAPFGLINIYSVSGQLTAQEKFNKDDKSKTIKLQHIGSGEYMVVVLVGKSRVINEKRLIIK
jgi:hypothetical protein